MLIRDFLLKNEKSFNFLYKNINNTCKSIITKHIFPRQFWEFGNTLSGVYRLCEMMGISKVDVDIIETITSTYSMNYFPELTHMSAKGYNQYYSEFYIHFLDIISKSEFLFDIKILDFGCGIIHMGLLLLDSLAISQYVGYDIDGYIVDLNSELIKYFSFYTKKHVKKIEIDAHTKFDDILSGNFNVCIFCNSIKSFKSHHMKRWITWIKSCTNKLIIIYDQYSIINTIQNSLCVLEIDCERDGNYLIVRKDSKAAIRKRR